MLRLVCVILPESSDEPLHGLLSRLQEQRRACKSKETLNDNVQFLGLVQGHLATILRFTLLAEERVGEDVETRVQGAKLLVTFHRYMIDGFKILGDSNIGRKEKRLTMGRPLRFQVQLLRGRRRNSGELFLESRHFAD
jgi:hypothetical protein